MGEKKTRLARFKSENPVCCYCGGGFETETIDHAPPRILFWAKHRPKGLEVPACKFCNERHGPFDAFCALMARTMNSAFKPPRDTKFKSLYDTVAQRFPNAMAELGSNGRHVYHERNGLLRHVVEVKFRSPEIHFALEYGAARQIVALFYSSTGVVPSVGSVIWASWRPNNQPYSPEFEAKMFSMLPGYVTLSQGDFSVPDQFEARLNFSDLGFCAAYMQYQESYRSAAFLLPPKYVEGFSPPEYGTLFEVTEECIQPVNAEFPKDVRLNHRKVEE